MSRENVEVVRSLYKIWERGGRTRSTDWAHPSIGFVIAEGPAAGTWTGRSRLADGWDEFVAVWEEFRPEVKEYRELDEDAGLSESDSLTGG